MGWTPKQIDEMDYKSVEIFKLIALSENVDKAEELVKIWGLDKR